MCASMPYRVSFASNGQSAKSLRSTTVAVAASTATASLWIGHRWSFWMIDQAVVVSAGTVTPVM